jgi:hypothetical protein
MSLLNATLKYLNFSTFSQYLLTVYSWYCITRRSLSLLPNLPLYSYYHLIMDLYCYSWSIIIDPKLTHPIQFESRLTDALKISSLIERGRNSKNSDVRFLTVWSSSRRPLTPRRRSLFSQGDDAVLLRVAVVTAWLGAV